MSIKLWLHYKKLDMLIWWFCHIRREHNWRVNDKGEIACRYCGKVMVN